MSEEPLPPKITSTPPEPDGAPHPTGATDSISAASIPAEAEPLLANVIEYLPDATFVLDAEKRVVAWNRACEILTGVKKERLLGCGDYAYAEPFYGERRPILVDLLDLPEPELEAKYAYVQRKDNVVYAETFVQRLRGGEGAYLSGEASALFDRHGHRCGYVESIRDITEHKRAEAELRRQEETLRSVFNGVPIGICIMKDRRYQKANRHWCEEFGYNERDIIGQTPRQLYDDEAEWQRVGVELYSRLDEKGETSIQTRLRRPDGELRDVAVTAARIDQADPASATVVIIHDVTEQKRTEDTLRLRNAILVTQQETSPDGILVVDEKGQILSVNRRFGEMWHIPQEILTAGSDRRALAWALTQVQRPRSFIRKVKDLYRHPERSSQDEFAMKDGRTFERYSAPMSADGTTLGRVWYFKDVTERKRAEVERDKAEQQLWRAQKMEAIGSLAGGVAHDFNNLLSVIMAFTGFALEQIHAGDPLAQDLLEVQKASERAAVLTRQLLAFGRKQVMHPVALNLNHVAKGLEGMLRRILGEDINLVLTLSNDVGAVRVDPSQFEQVLMNLVANARDAMAAGGTLTIATSNIKLNEETRSDAGVMPPGHYVQLAVSDTGCGMDEETIGRIFEPFYTTKEMGKGTGLGLSTVFGIIKQSGGDILVSSKVGRGSTFKIRLPRDTAQSAEFSCPAPALQHPSRGTETILVVEDEPALRAVAKRALTEAGYNVLVASSGDEAVGLCVRYRGDIHLLLTDVIMPGMSGPALARELVQSRAALKVLYMSGYADNAFGSHAQLGEGAHFLPKPFTAGDMTRKVRIVLDA